MRYTVSVSRVSVIGPIWMPAATCAMDYDLSAYDIENVKGYADAYDTDLRGGLEQWLARNSGDFQSVSDFTASLEIDGTTVEIPWMSEESELTYSDCMFGAEEDYDAA